MSRSAFDSRYSPDPWNATQSNRVPLGQLDGGWAEAQQRGVEHTVDRYSAQPAQRGRKAPSEKTRTRRAAAKVYTRASAVTVTQPDGTSSIHKAYSPTEQLNIVGPLAYRERPHK